MRIKTVLVNLNHEQRVTAVLAAAADIAQSNSAHLIGLYVMPPLFMPSDVIVPMGSEFYEQQITDHLAQAERIRKTFEDQTRGQTFVAEWRIHGEARSAYESLADGVIAQARSADLVVVSQARDGVASPMLTDIAERVALEGGRPVLVVPASWTPQPFGKNVTVAWNDSRESSRALFDAIPLLTSANMVHLSTLGDTVDADEKPVISGVDAAEALARHGVAVAVDSIPNGGGSIGATLLARAIAHNSDLIVMGAYGHSRMREFILGGVTRDMLKAMTVPVLMSH
jgi:nucleotide-binding universal stress UspA family protein